MNVVETFGLGVRFGHTWALRDCTLSIPEGHVVAVVGSNGAGKTTFLHCVVGLTEPTCGELTVLGGRCAGTLGALERIAFVAQEAPLYRHLSVRQMLEVAANLNEKFDSAFAIERLAALEIPLRRRVGKLSGGQQSQLALTLALARRPELLVLDEPLARLDPVARHDAMALVLETAADKGTSVLFSSHVVSELERVADYLICIARGCVQLVGPIEDLLACHLLLDGPAKSAAAVADQFRVVRSQSAAGRVQLLVQLDSPVEPPPGWEAGAPSLDELVQAYLRDPTAIGRSGPLAVAGERSR